VIALAYLSGSIAAVSGSATALPQPGKSGYVLSNLSTSVIAYYGGPNVTTATGIPLGTSSPSNTVILPGRQAVVTPADTDDAIYVRTASSSAVIAHLIPAAHSPPQGALVMHPSTAHICQLQADHLVIGPQCQRMQLFTDPRAAHVLSRRRIVRSEHPRRGDPFIPAAMH
jgi:hypothetical protein